MIETLKRLEEALAEADRMLGNELVDMRAVARVRVSYALGLVRGALDTQEEERDP